MSTYKITYSKNDSEKRVIITLPVEIKSLTEPLTLTREKGDEITEEVQLRQNTKKRSEAIEIEDDNYKQLKETERRPLLITDREQRSFTGRLQDMNICDEIKNNDNYFMLINKGSTFRLIPASKRYRFSQKTGNITISLEEAESRMSKRKRDKWLEYNARKEERKNLNEDKDDKDIDYDEEFDDDDGDDVFIVESEEKELSLAGEELKNLMNNYEAEVKEEEEDSDISGDKEKTTSSLKSHNDDNLLSPVKRRSDRKDEKSRKNFKGMEGLNDAFFRSCLKKIPMKATEFADEVKKYFPFSQNVKESMKKFMDTYCKTEITGSKNEKYVWLIKK